MVEADDVVALARCLHDLGYVDPTSRIVACRNDGSFFVTPLGRSWDNLIIDNLVEIAPDGRKAPDDDRPVSPALASHLAIHAADEHAVVTVHSHPFWPTLWAIRGELPPAYDHESARLGNVAIYDDAALTLGAGQFASWVEAAKDSEVLLLRNHGVLLVGATPEATYVSARTLERRAHLGWLCQGEQPLRIDVANHIRSVFPSFAAKAGLFQLPHDCP